ncbi:hypothetical protein RIF29_19172 [Crotalaria pallida]|uniref:Uncharacterized protein n=1 Tax=Crotalaria pallida TaxID=3830 RepID=A0AAN9F0A5_CROPI
MTQHMADGIERINYLCSPEGRRDDVPIETYLAEMKLETDHMMVSMNQANRCYLSIQEAPASSQDPDITNVDESGQVQQSPSIEDVYIPSPLPHGYMSSPQYPGYMSMPQMQGYNTPSPYDPLTSTPSAPARWDRETVSPSVDFYELAGTSAPQIDLNTQIFDESNDHNDNQDARRNPHRGARDRHWRCGT